MASLQLPATITFLQGYYTGLCCKTWFITRPPHESTRAIPGPVTFTHEFRGHYTLAPLTEADGDQLTPGMVVSTTTGEHVLVCSIPTILPRQDDPASLWPAFRPPSNVSDYIAIYPGHYTSAN